ncbi:MAG: copper chaperone PCu(A)C [Alphaproteobacteria bacterium]|nr:copper chaperone PCu(A)C [Alphaproteobacteria bacterium]MBV9377872.1 copper chaperone PCu(A)C [Alphaproteobacteria bacterium]
MSIKIFAFVAGLAAASAALAQPAQLEVNNAWARATPGKSETGAAYVTIQSPTADRLVSASSPVAKKAELHTMSMQGMVMKMRPIAGLDIPPGQPVSLKPGGEHIMLMGLNQALHEGQSFPLTLDFEKAGPRTVTVTVEKAGSNGPPQR